MKKDSVIVFAPAGIANVGPCYDLMGYALDYVGDFVTIRKVPEGHGGLLWGGVTGPAADDLAGVPPEENVVWVVADHMLREHVDRRSLDFSIELSLHKYLPVASGLGSSAASGVATVRAMVELFGLEPSDAELVRDLEVGEEFTCGAGHPDNVLPSYFGGFAFFCPKYREDGTDGKVYQLPTDVPFFSIVVKPKGVQITTEQGRERFRQYIERNYMSEDSEPAELLDFATMHAAKAADMVLAVLNGDIRRLGWIMSNNRHLEAARGPLIPRFHEVKDSAIAAGAFGCSIAGSGPSVVAVVDTEERALKIRDGMVQAFEQETQWLISPLGRRGARIVESIEAFVEAGRKWNSFMIT